MRVIRRIRRLVEAWIVYRWRTAEQSMEILRGPVDGVAHSENFPVNGFRLMVALAGCSLVAPLIHLTRGETSRHLFNVAAGLFAGVFVFDTAVLHTIGTAIVVYLLMMLAPRKLVGRIVLPLLLTYLVGIHYYREFYSPDIVWDSAQMILTLKLSSVAINYSDGGLPKEKKTPTMLKNELQEIPGLIPYFGFIFFFPTYLAGPAFEYKDYIYWMKDIRFAPFMVHLRNLFVIVVSAAGFFASLQFPVDEIDSPDFYPESSWAVRCLRMCIPVVLFRFRFYLAWSLAEAASAAAGVGYVQATGKWNGITNNDLLCVELPTNFRVAINSWNIGVARWINTCTSIIFFHAANTLDLLNVLFLSRHLPASRSDQVWEVYYAVHDGFILCQRSVAWTVAWVLPVLPLGWHLHRSWKAPTPSSALVLPLHRGSQGPLACHLLFVLQRHLPPTGFLVRRLGHVLHVGGDAVRWCRVRDLGRASLPGHLELVVLPPTRCERWPAGFLQPLPAASLCSQREENAVRRSPRAAEPSAADCGESNRSIAPP
ncbi:hypothetical protein F441_17868, partial [Phytophthora nicotianae CJ01A1]